jgi:ribonucleoside-diphosphate reductase beta chain
MSIFDKRVAVKPYEYEHLLDYMKAIRGTIWYIDEFKERLDRDVNDYHNVLTKQERGVIKRALLAISQIEVSVKTFWGKVGDNLPKPEIYMVGYTFAMNEVIHQEAYSELLTRLGLEGEFAKALKEPVIQGRVDYLTKYIKGASENKQENYALNLLLFSAFIESCSLFSQFYIVKSFCQKKQKLKTIDNIIMATAKEEDVHFQFGAALINIIKKEYPEWFNEDFYAKIRRACKKAYEAELKIIDWIFKGEDLDFISRAEADLFIQDRFNKALEAIGMSPMFEVDVAQLGETSKWFEEERVLDVRVDFFDVQSPNYTVGQQDISAESLF